METSILNNNINLLIEIKQMLMDQKHRNEKNIDSLKISLDELKEQQEEIFHRLGNLEKCYKHLMAFCTHKNETSLENRTEDEPKPSPSRLLSLLYVSSD